MGAHESFDPFKEKKKGGKKKKDDLYIAPIGSPL